MAKVDLLPNKEFKIVLDNGEQVAGKFGTWALKRFCQKRNMTLAQVSEKLGNPEIDDGVEFILSAVEQAFRESKSKDSFPYNDVDACSWVDQLGGFSGAEFVKLFSHAGDEEKKNPGDQ